MENQEIRKLADKLNEQSLKTNKHLFWILENEGFESVNKYLTDVLGLESVGGSYDDVKAYLLVNKKLLKGEYATKSLNK